MLRVFPCTASRRHYPGGTISGIMDRYSLYGWQRPPQYGWKRGSHEYDFRGLHGVHVRYGSTAR